MNNAIILQQCSSASNWMGAPQWAGVFYDMLRLTNQRHAAYARAHKFDYWCIYGDIHGEKWPGAWGKIYLLLDAFERGYEYAVWLDTDAAIMDFETDLRAALPDGVLIGAAVHDPARSEYLAKCLVPKHMNVGVLYMKNDPRTVDFLTKWRDSFPGHPRWCEQGSFNDIAQDNPIVAPVDDRWNATIGVNEVDNPVVLGWHGVQPAEKRLGMMRSKLYNDFLDFRV